MGDMLVARAGPITMVALRLSRLEKRAALGDLPITPHDFFPVNNQTF